MVIGEINERVYLWTLWANGAQAATATKWTDMKDGAKAQAILHCWLTNLRWQGIEGPTSSMVVMG